MVPSLLVDSVSEAEDILFINRKRPLFKYWLRREGTDSGSRSGQNKSRKKSEPSCCLYKNLQKAV